MRSITIIGWIILFSCICIKKRLSKLVFARQTTSLLLGMAQEKNDFIHYRLDNIRIDAVLDTETKEKLYWLGPLKLLLKYCFIKLKYIYFLDVTVLALKTFGGITLFDKRLKT